MNQTKITEMSAVPTREAKKGLTSLSLKSKAWGMKSEVQKLIEQVKRKASKPGAKSQLARALGVAPARISEWLSGEKEPGGEYTLKLLHWVEQQERQK
jgi:transcriptional regulator with XRE-family HTH domain